MIEVLKQWAEDVSKVYDILAFGHTERALEILAKTRTSLRQAIAELESQEPVAHSVISGALFDFMGWLTSRKERIVLSSADNASPAVEAITEFARMRNLSLDDAKVQDWHTHPPQRTWQGLTDEEIKTICLENGWDSSWQSLRFSQAIEAKLKERNG